MSLPLYFSTIIKKLFLQSYPALCHRMLNVNKTRLKICRARIYSLQDGIWYFLHNLLNCTICPARGIATFFFFFFIILISADSTIEPGARRCVKRIYKSTTVIYTRRTTLSLKKNLAWRVRTRLCACTCEVFFTSAYICGQRVSRCGAARNAAILCAPLIFRLHFYRLVHWPTLFRNIAASRSRARANDLSRWHFDNETIGHRGLNKRFHNLTVFIQDLSLSLFKSLSLSFSLCRFIPRSWRVSFDSSPVVF